MDNEFTILPSYDVQEADAWLSQNAKLGLLAPSYRSKTGSIAVCGNGPSLLDNIPKIGQIAALNNAWRTLVKNGVMPDYIIAHDPSPQNVAFFEDCPDEPIYLLASSMHPSVFASLQGKTVRQWHCHGDGERKLGLGPLVGGGFSIGCAALNLLNLIGYDHFDLHGYDSCYSLTGKHHSTPQDWNITPPQVYQVGDRAFLAEPWMAAQVQELLKQLQANKYNYTVDVNGDGMFAAALEHNTLKVIYDLDVAPGSFDFMCSMLNVENYRAEAGYSRIKVHFKPGSNQGFRPVDVIDIGHKQKNQMLNHVVRPLLEMFGMEESGPIDKPSVYVGSIEKHGDGVVSLPYSPRPSVEHYKETGKLPRYEASAEATSWASAEFSDRPYVITLREADYWPQRNSNLSEWVRFAETLDRRVIFVRDTAKASEEIDGFEICQQASVDLHKRLALYRMARMNFFVTNGPAGLAHYSTDIPYLNFYKDAPGYHCYDPVWLEQYVGIPPGGQLPWATKSQRLVYANDTFENIVKAWNDMGLGSPVRKTLAHNGAHLHG